MTKKEKTTARTFLIIGFVLGFLLAGGIWGPVFIKYISWILATIFFTGEFILWLKKKRRKEEKKIECPPRGSKSA